jgi:hypothetical protein
MIAWFLTEVPISRYELILLYGLVLIFGLLGGIGWITLAMEIRPIKLSAYFASLVRAIAKYWFNKKHVKSKPISNPKDDTEDIKDTLIKSKARPLRPVPRPDESGSRRAKQEQKNAQDNFPHVINLTQGSTKCKQNRG